MKIIGGALTITFLISCFLTSCLINSVKTLNLKLEEIYCLCISDNSELWLTY